MGKSYLTPAKMESIQRLLERLSGQRPAPSQDLLNHDSAVTIRELLAEIAEFKQALRDIGQYAEDNLHNTTLLTSLPPQNPVAFRVHQECLSALSPRQDANPRPAADKDRA